MTEPLYRITFDAAALLREHPPRVSHSHKAALLAAAYPQGAEAAGTIEVTRWPREPMGEGEVDLPEALDAVVAPNFYDYEPVNDPVAAEEWHVNFADPRLFVAYGSGLFAQDEMQVAEHPLLGSVREALESRGLATSTTDRTGPTPVLVHGVERRLIIATSPDAAAGRPRGLYGNRFAQADVAMVLRATRRVEPPTTSHIIAMAAPAGGVGEYTAGEIGYVLATAVTAFTASRRETARARPPHHDDGAAVRTIVHSGFWGCGAFGGNRRLMVALQALAARIAGIDRLVLHAGDPSGTTDAERGLDIAAALALRCGPRCTMAMLIDRVALLGYSWGVSDGN